MMRRGAVRWALLVCAALCLLAGRETAARLAWALGWPGAAALLSGDPAVRAVALYRQGRFAEADAAVAALGRAATYDRAMTLAATGDYALSVAYFDAVLFADRDDAMALRNRDLVAALVPVVVGEGDGAGRIDRVIAAAGPGPSDRADSVRGLQLPNQRSIRKPVDARSVAADEDWLATLDDAPGAFLARRLAAEHARRAAAGVLHKSEPVEW